ncbi:MAG TPA: M20 family peptidase [Xanthomonadales bacterium]|nr:M20 family peptidase [Xanthomonadales bacterium]
MKKAIGLLVLALLLLVALMVYRASTYYADQSGAPRAAIVNVPIDEDAAVQRLARSLTYPTISHDDRSNFDAAAFRGFHEYLQQAYPLVHQHMQRSVISGYSLVYHLPGSDPNLPPVLFMGHMDVVPVQEDTLPDWTYPPFDGVVAKGVVWGRGSVDDKLGVIGLLEATELLLQLGIKPERGLYLAFGHNEEVGGADGAQAIARHFEQQGIRFDFVMDEGGALTQGMVGHIDQPVAVIGVSEKGYINLVLTVNDSGGHSSQPPKHTALGILSQAIVNVENQPFPARLDSMLPTIDAIGAYLPFGERLAMSNLWLLEPIVKRQLLNSADMAAGIRTTTAATMASGSPKSNILPTRAQAVINFRILPGETVETVRKRVVEIINDERVEVSAEYGSDPSPVSPTGTRGYELIASTIRAFLPETLVAPYMVRGGTDAKYFYSVSDNVYRFAMIRVTPETVRFVHGIDERLPVEDYLMAIRFYYNLVKQAVAE